MKKSIRSKHAVWRNLDGAVLELGCSKTLAHACGSALEQTFGHLESLLLYIKREGKYKFDGRSSKSQANTRTSSATRASNKDIVAERSSRTSLWCMQRKITTRFRFKYLIHDGET